MHLKSVIFHPDTYPTRERYPFNLPIFHEARELLFDTPVTLFVGENGTGKSTLLEALSRKCDIHIWRNTQTRRHRPNPYEERFFHHISVKWVNGRVPGSFFGASVFQDFVQILEGWAAEDPGLLEYFGGKSLVAQSHGQSIMSFFKARFKREGLYFLDEPETALSPKSQLRFLDMLSKLDGNSPAQFVISTHSPILLSCPGAVIYSFDHIPIRSLEYKETGHYRIFREFMEKQG